MNTKDRPAISIPTFLTEAFRTAALESDNDERIWLEAEEAAGQHFEAVFSAGCLTEDALVLYYNPYDILPYAAGSPEVKVPYADTTIKLALSES